MRGVVVAVALCALVSGAEAKTWTCQQLGYTYCEGDKCFIGLARVTADVDVATIREDMSLDEGDRIRFTPLADRRPATAVYLVTRDDGVLSSYGHCWAKVTARR